MPFRWFLGAALLIVSALIIAGPARAAYAYPTPPAGWGGGPGAWTYGGTASANAAWVNGSAAAQVTVNVGGRPVTMPAAMRMASNAGQFIARQGIVTQALGRSVPFIAWALAAGWVWDQVSQRWRVPVSGSYWQACNLQGNCGAILPTPGEACASLYPQYGGGAVNVGTSGSPQWRCTNSGGSSLGNAGVVSAQQPPAGTTREATNGDADALGNTPMPAGLPGVADDVVPIPVELPVINPSADPVPQPLPMRIPVGDPVPQPGTNPQEYTQPVADIVPASVEPSPWRVDIRSGQVTSVNQGGLVGPVNWDDPDSPPGGSAAAPEPEPGMCDRYPDIAACQQLGDAGEAGVIPTYNVPLSFESPVSFGPSTAACPSPRLMHTALAGTLEFSYEGACMYADGIRPVVIALAYLSSILAFFGIGSRD